jgi:hypothetical protein
MAAANANFAAFVDEMEAAADAAILAQRNEMIASLAVFGYNAATRTAIVNALNLREPQQLYAYSDKTLEGFTSALLKRYTFRANNPIVIPLTVGEDLRVYKMWVQGRFWQGLPTTANLFDEGAAATARARIEELRIIGSAARVEITTPSLFKTSATFVEFKQHFDHACSRHRGVCGVPIKWIYREEAEVTAAILAANYATRDEYFMATMLRQRRPTRGPT